MSLKTEQKIINEQILATKLFILSLLISLLLAYNQKRYLNEKDVLFNQKKVKIIAISNRIFAIFIVLFYLYIDNESLELASDKEKKLRKMQCYLEIIYLLAAIIALYITVKSNSGITENENSNIWKSYSEIK